jgi:Fe-S oxidoreductase
VEAAAQAASAGVARNGARTKEPRGRAVIFADLFTNYSSPSRGLATLRVMEKLGADVVVSPVCADGRAALSQGLIATARRQAERTATMLETYIADGRDVVVVEPSVLAMFRLDFGRLLDGPRGPGRFQRIRERCFDPCEYVVTLLSRNNLDPQNYFPATDQPRGTRVMLHCHCQQKTIGAAAAVEGLLRLVGFDVATSDVECCGMAGSFGYKKEYYDLSMAVGRQLFDQVQQIEAAGGSRTIVASGTSCQEQLNAGLERRILHPMELLAEAIEEIEGRAKRRRAY